jgi:serine phosphatase RsbU (regulator of sigma subunit)
MSANPIHNIPLFASLPQKVLNELEKTLGQVELPAGVVLFSEGDPSDSFYIILEGEIAVTKALGAEEERLLATRGAGEYIGEMGLLVKEGQRTASVKTLSPAHFIKITHEDFDRLLQRWPMLGREMLRELSLRLNETNNDVIRDLLEKNRELAAAYEELKAAQAQIIQKEMLERELQMARKIQESILPHTLPRPQAYDFGARMVPARAVGGDFFDIIPFDRNMYGVVIGDVSDKGVPAAIFMGLTRSLLRAKASRSASPSKVLQRVNELLLEMNEEGMFVTVLYGVLDCLENSFTYARAGHESPLVFAKDGEQLPLACGQGQPLGIFSRPELDEQSLLFPPGGVLLMYTDGAVDLVDSKTNLFGMENLLEVIRANLGCTAQEICDHVLLALNGYAGETPQADDITLVAAYSHNI